MTRILFVCLGNICRSPSAEGVMRARADEAGLGGRIDIDSAGTGAWHVGNPPDRRAQKTAGRRGYDLSALRARQVRHDDFETFDLVIAMDRSNRDDLLAQCPRAHAGKISLLLDYTTDRRGENVPDPYYGGDEGFEHMFDLIESAIDGLLDRIAGN